MRRTFISVTWTPGVDDDDAQVMIRAIEDIYSLLKKDFGPPGQFDPLPTVRVFGSWVIPNLPDDAVYSNIAWYIKRTLDDSRENILASRYHETVLLEPWQSNSPHFDYSMTNFPIIDDISASAPEQSDEAVGTGIRGLFSVVSTYPFREIASDDLRKLALRHTTAHYFGRLMDIPLPRRAEAITEIGGERFCTNNCAMRFMDTSTLAVSFAQQEIADGHLYCDLCRRDLASMTVGWDHGMN